MISGTAEASSAVATTAVTSPGGWEAAVASGATFQGGTTGAVTTATGNLGVGGGGGALGGLFGEGATDLLVAGIPKAIEMGFAGDPGEVTDKDKFEAEQRDKDRAAQLQASLASAGAASDFHLAEKLRMQEDLYEKRGSEMRLAESIRSQPHRLAGGVRRAAGGYLSGQGVQAEKAQLLAGTPTKGSSPSGDLSQPITNKNTALKGIA